MPTNRDPNAGNMSVAALPIARNFALTVLVALVLLIILRHLFGSIKVEVSTK